MADQSVGFTYIYKEINPRCANGAYGAVPPRGEIALSFFVERLPIPKSTTHAVAPDGSIGDVIATDPPQEPNTVFAIRFITCGVILSVDTAKRVHGLLGRQLEQMELAQAEILKRGGK